MKDFLKQELAVGDRVVHGRSGRYGGLNGPFFIHSFTPKMVRVSLRNEPEPYMTVNADCLVKVQH